MNIALVLSGGIGRRLASDVPKQYVTVNGKMIIIYTLQSLCAHEMIDAVHVVAARAWWEPMITELPDASKLKGFSEPGENRQYSIINGLKDISAYADESDVVLIQDGVRPCVSDDMISDVLNAVKGHDGAVPVLPLKDTVYLSEDGKKLSSTIRRSKLLAGQAPEAFVLGRYLAANNALKKEQLLELSGSAEPALLSGLDIVTVSGDEKNFKITTNGDLKRFIQLVSAQ
ncbi:MAG: 2-C-methyl-D-erythritol 4-phosphate cytidylyltransferase [Lachnospiraceae bacterium]|nr:2-C-methyl-D-erythritol 4-phosphate cytidylyltransferase [Lachnospiraceae bacterium]